MTETQTERTTLYYREGSSDKVYHIAIEPSGTGFAVNFAYGRRGSTMSTGTKTAKPVDRATAKNLFDKLVKEKTAKGYTPGEDGTPYQHTDKADRATGIFPQLLNPIDESEVEQYLTEERFWMQEKFDGRRVLIRKQGNTVTAINRNGLTAGLPLPIVEAVQLLSATDCLLDGEAVGDIYYAFDLLQADVTDMRASPYSVRQAMMMDLADGVQSDGLRYVESARSAKQKREMLERLKQERKEGAVFKDSSAPYTPGRPASGGSQFKFKFTASCSCIVAGGNASKRSVKLELLDNTAKRVSVGNVTIPANQKIPTAGQIIEVRYLYAYPGGSLYQPVSLGVRDDITLADCRLSQLKYRAENTTDDEN
jgi:bifunctional non-homologous end joining protein LigD